MSLGISSSDFTQVLSDLGASITYRAFNDDTAGGLDEYGGTTYAWDADTTKTWIFFKHGSKIDLAKYGITEIADAYVIMPSTDSMKYRDRIIDNSEVFEFSPDCLSVLRVVGGISLFRYFTLNKVGEDA